MLLNNFFTIQEESSTEVSGKSIITAQICIDKKHSIFEGHFPNQPIVPGVCMIQIIKEILEKHRNQKLYFTTGSNIKFLSMINPEVNSTLNVEINYNNSNPDDVDAKLFLGEIIFFKVKGSFSSKLF